MIQFWDEENQKHVTVTVNNPLPVTGIGGGTVEWDNIQGKPEEFPPSPHTHTPEEAGAAPATHTHAASAITSGTLNAARIPTLDQSKISNLTADLAAKLTATQAAAQADSVAEDITTLVADFNALLAKLRAAGIMGE